ncbi:unnamed protein product [Durusdinium trenchii]|uniref:Uncharacterized protein n=1 Tax=Durusdinium trenchii TaxID=1381693 RepID=A0ABP0NC63_9DINO
MAYPTAGHAESRTKKAYPAALSSRTSVSSRGAPGTSPQPGSIRAQRPMSVSGLDHKSIVAMSQLCTEDLDAKMREKSALSKQLADLKRAKLQYDTKLQKKKKEDDSVIVQTMDMEKKLQTLNNSNRVATAELSGLGAENERLRQDIDALRSHLQEATVAYETECEALEGLKQALQATRKELAAETKQRDVVQQDLRASRTAQTLMINRLDDIERRNKALKNCVASAMSR